MGSRLKGCAIAATLLVGVVSARADDALILPTNLTSNVTVLAQNFVASATSYSLFEGWGSITGGSSAVGAFGAYITAAGSNTVLGSLFEPASVNAPGGAATSPVNGFVVGDTYTLKAFASAFPGSSYTVSNFLAGAISNSVAVPGPVAGEGLPALLCFLGISTLFWRKKSLGLK